MSDLTSPRRFADRRLVAASLFAAAALALAAAPGIAQQKKGPPPAGEVSVEELMKPGTLPDLAIGKADAPVTIVEYASLTCGHCATFHTTVYPKLKEKYVDTGKVRLVLRDFPLDNLAAAAAMLARCTPADKAFGLIGELFAKQDQWAFVQGNPVPTLFKVAEANGFTKESFDKCLQDQKLLEGITGTRERANKSFQVRSTPTFFVNGRRLDGRSDALESFDKAIEAATAKPAAAPAPAPKK